MKAAVAITFHFDQNRLVYLQQVCAGLFDIANEVNLYIFTNVRDGESLAKIRSCTQSVPNSEVISPTYLGHPYLLTWSHKSLFRQILSTDRTVTHFLYLEDDLAFTRKNMDYFLAARAELREYRLIPGFLRFEEKTSSDIVLTDIVSRQRFNETPKVELGGAFFVSLSRPYQGMYLFDRELAEEYFSWGGAGHFLSAGSWGIRETAAAGLTFKDPPPNFFSRIAVGFKAVGGVYAPVNGVLIQHLPNNYVANPLTKFGKVRSNSVFY